MWAAGAFLGAGRMGPHQRGRQLLVNDLVETTGVLV